MRKILSSILVGVLFLTSTSFAAEQNRFYTISGFEKGLNNNASDYSVPKNQCTVANNVRFNQYSSLAKRPVMLQGYTFGSTAINGLHRYYKTDGTKKLIGATSTKLYVGDDAAGTGQVIKTGLSDGKQWQFVTYKDVAIGMNGYDLAVKYDGKVTTTSDTDGARTANELCAQLGAPFAELNTGSNLDASSWYMYKVAFYDGTTYHYSTARSNPILTGATVRDVTLTDIPLGPEGTTHRYVYRTEGKASQAAVEAETTYYQLVDISDNTTRTYNDAKSDATISVDPAPTWGTVSSGVNATPPLGALCTIHNERLFIGGNKTNLSEIYWSDTFNPDYFDPDNLRPIREDDGDSVTFLKTHLGILTIGKQNTIQKFYTEDENSDNWVVSDPFTRIGCPAPYSVANSPVGIIYLARDGLYAFNGQTSTYLSDAIKPVIDDVLPTNITSVWGHWFKNEYHMAYTSSESGSTTNNRVLVFDTVRLAYSVDTKNINSFADFSSGDDFGVLYMGSSASDGKIWANEDRPNVISKRLVSEFNAGTFDDARVYGDENDPTMELAWDTTINAASGSINAQAGDINRPDTDGTWTSPVYEVNADTLGLLYWNEMLSNGDVTFQVRTGATLVAIAAASYSSAFTNPNGSDLSGVSASKYIQFKINLSTNDIDTTPTLFVANGYLFKMTYTISGATQESAVLSEWTSGKLDFGLEGYQKFIRRIKVFYSGTSGTVTFNYTNERGTANRSFTIDLSKDPNESTTDPYTGSGDQKVYTHYPAQNSSSSPAPVGQFFQLAISESGTVGWKIDRVEIMYYPEEISNP